LGAAVDSSGTSFPVYGINSQGDTLIEMFEESQSQFRLLESTIPIHFRNCHRGEKYDFYSALRSTCSYCENSYSLAENADDTVIACTPCPIEAESCYGATINLYPGNFRWSVNANTIYSCPLPRGCRGGNTTGAQSCNDGYYGAQCSSCSTGYYLSSGQCLVCNGSQSVSVSRISFYLTVFAMIFSFLVFVFRKKIFNRAGSNDAVHVFQGTEFQRRAMGVSDSDNVPNVAEQSNLVMKARLSGKLCVVTYQIIINCPTMFVVEMPPMFAQLMSSLNFISFNFGQSLPADCSNTSLNYLQRMAITTSLPIIFVVVLSALYFNKAYRNYRSLLSRNDKDRVNRELQITYAGYVLTALYFILPTISVCILKCFDCVDMDVNNEDPNHVRHILLRDDYTISCDSQEYYYWYKWAVVMVVIYPVMIPCVFFLLLFVHRHEIKHRDIIDEFMKSESVFKRRHFIYNKQLSFVESIKFLYANYHPNYWYWEFIDVTRRLLLTAVLALIMTGTSTQIVVGIIMALMYTALFGQFKPYKIETLNILLLEGQYQILFTFIAVLVVKQNFIPEIPYHEDVLDAGLIACNSAMLFSIILSIRRDFNESSKVLPTSTKTVRKILLKSNISLQFIHDRIMCEELLENCSSDSLQVMLTLIFQNIYLRKRDCLTRYVYYTPVNNDNRKFLRFDSQDKEVQHEVSYKDIENCTVYLRIPQFCIDNFRFRTIYQNRIVEIPGKVFHLSFHLQESGYAGKIRMTSALDEEDSWGSVSTPDFIPIPECILQGWDPIFSDGSSSSKGNSSNYISSSDDESITRISTYPSQRTTLTKGRDGPPMKIGNAQVFDSVFSILGVNEDFEFESFSSEANESYKQITS